ncbi:endonuclease/exonuclease/phosphatase family protein [Mycoplasmopsis agassizii]|uniref:endonuclease/exonuclease/phosphatase family protein n=1 Tax=Mycoplasmopsis agassizii TaxID=33922 RepID=UPI0035298157
MKKSKLFKLLVGVAPLFAITTAIACSPIKDTPKESVTAQSIIDSLPNEIKPNSSNLKFDQLKETLKKISTNVQNSFLNLLDQSNKTKLETALKDDYKISKITLVVGDSSKTSLQVIVTVSKGEDSKTKTIKITDLVEEQKSDTVSAQSIIDSLPSEIKTNQDNKNLDKLKTKLKDLGTDVQATFLNLLDPSDKTKFETSLKDDYKISKITLVEPDDSKNSLSINLSVSKGEDLKTKSIKITDLKQTHENAIGEPGTGTIQTEVSSLKIATWNLLNYGAKANQVQKTELIAKIITHNKYDIVSTQEINPVDKKSEEIKADKVMLEALNKLDTDKDWKAFVSPKSVGKLSQQKGQAEWFIVFYKSSKVEATGWSKIYDDKGWPGTNLKDSDTTYYYARPPFAAQFKTLGKVENTFTLVSAHLDAPGNGSDTRVEKPSGLPDKQGNQEVEEALQLVNVLKTFDEEDGINNEIIFMGDTNIKKGNEAVAFKPVIDNGYANLLNDNTEDSSTLQHKIGEFANPYDKIFYKGNLKVSNASRYNLWESVGSVFSNEEWEEYKKTFVKKYKGGKNKGKPYRTGEEYYYWINMISDHAPVSFKLHMDAKDETTSKAGTLELLTREQVKAMAKTTV